MKEQQPINNANGGEKVEQETGGIATGQEQRVHRELKPESKRILERIKRIRESQVLGVDTMFLRLD